MRIHRIGDGAAGILHQRQRRNAGFDREPVGFAHFRDGEDFTHHPATAAKYAFSRFPASSRTACFLQKAKRTRSVGPPSP